MGKTRNVPIMTPEEERFMAFEGLVQWTAAVVDRKERLNEARLALSSQNDPASRRLASLRMHTECHYFSIAANKLLEHRKWVVGFGLCKNVDFLALDAFSETDIRDLRNMREHVVDYFKGDGRDKDRWFIETPEFKADASSLINTLIGGRLDWAFFGAAAKELLPALLNEPIPYPGRVSTET